MRVRNRTLKNAMPRIQINATMNSGKNEKNGGVNENIGQLFAMAAP